MALESKYPFKMTQAFFKEVSVKRAPRLPDPIELPVAVEILILDRDIPERLEIALRFITVGDDEQPISLHLELIGIFDLIEGQEAPEPRVIRDFLHNQALHMLSPLIAQMVRQTTSMMGMPPINIPIPYVYEIAFKPGSKLVADELEEDKGAAN